MITDRRYGNRELFQQGAKVTRPDGSVFRQGVPATYRRTTIPPVTVSDDRPNLMTGAARLPRKDGGPMQNTLGVSGLAPWDTLDWLTELDRQLSETGLSWLVTVEHRDGRRAVVSRLRSHREGNGGPWLRPSK
jgi:hypothetical protein